MSSISTIENNIVQAPKSKFAMMAVIAEKAIFPKNNLPAKPAEEDKNMLKGMFKFLLNRPVAINLSNSPISDSNSPLLKLKSTETTGKISNI